MKMRVSIPCFFVQLKTFKMPSSFFCVLILLLTCSAITKAGEQVEGIYAEKVRYPGYYLVTRIPEGSRSINVTELSRTINFLAIRLQNGSYLFNGNNEVDSSNQYEGAGTKFVYIRRNNYTSEMFYSLGTLKSPIDVMLLYSKNVPRVFYQYELPEHFETTKDPVTEISQTKSFDLESIPTTQFLSTNSANIMMGDEIRSSTATPKRRRKRRFFWKAAGFTRCSKSCGGGFQSKRYGCFRQRLSRQVQVPDRKCESLEKRKPLVVRCNSVPCPPQWEGSQWSECSVTCGNGTRTRKLQCNQEVSGKLKLQLESQLCPAESAKSIALEEPCFMPDCNMYTTAKSIITTKQYDASPQWKTGEWTPCSRTCGHGKRTRTVTCVTFGKPCNNREKPTSEESCFLADCKTKSIEGNEIPEALVNRPWLYSAWPDKCSSECGSGILSRRLYCESFLQNGTCEHSEMPSINRTCFSGNTCGQWFAGPWTKCSSSCDIGIETREVVCIVRFLKSLKVVDPVNCQGEKPGMIKGCMGPPCNATWFMSDWSQCSRSCGSGSQTREVKCVGPDGQPMNASELECDEENRPDNKRNCNDIPCNKPNIKETNALADSEIGNDVEDECRDKLVDCWRISHNKKHCQKEHYKIGCCKACRYYLKLESNE